MTTTKAKPRTCARPSRCLCGAPMRRGDLIVYVPRDAKPGQPRRWVLAGCECAS